MKHKAYHQFNHWLKTFLGQKVLMAEQNALKSFKEYISADYCIILGSVAQFCLSTYSQAKKKFLILPKTDKFQANIKSIPQIIANYSSLPLRSYSVDMLLLPHTLDLTDCANYILQETHKALAPRGFLIIIGINPFSLLGLWILFSKCFKKKEFAWINHLYFPCQIHYKLKKLGLHVIKYRRCWYRPPVQHKKLFYYLKFIEFFGKHLLFFCNGIYVLVAKQTNVGLTPLNPHWKKIVEFFEPSFAKNLAKGSFQHE